MFGYLKPDVCFTPGIILVQFRELSWAHTKCGAAQRKRQDPKQSCCGVLFARVGNQNGLRQNLPPPPKNPVFITDLDVDASYTNTAVMYPQSSYSARETPRVTLRESSRELREVLHWHGTKLQEKVQSQGDVFLNKSYLWSLVLTPIWDG